LSTQSTLPDPFPPAAEPWLRDRAAMVTGGGQNGEEAGVGYAICRTFAAHGAEVAVVDRDKDAAQRTVDAITQAGGTAHVVVADVLDDEDCARACARAVEAMGKVDTLVNNVAVGDRTGLFDVDLAEWHRLMDLNLTSAWLISKHVVPLLGPGSAMVNISSVGVRARGPGMVYNVAKAGLENFTVGAANSLGPQGVRVNAVQVGAIWSSFAARAMTQELREQRKSWSALGTEGTPWDIAQAALFLASDRARWVSGQILSVDGGPGGGPRPSGAAK
jgi:NAD(P)-dependent dehydrogenase (short-subunit alcohol dehydrogenase family)